METVAGEVGDVSDAGGPVSRRRYALFVALLVGLFMARGVMLASIVPPLEMWDEYQHVAYIVFLQETGHPPVLGEAGVPVSLARAVVGFPQSRWAMDQLAGSGAKNYRRFWENWDNSRPPESQKPVYNASWDPAGHAIYEAQHPPLYYRLARPLFYWAGGTDHLGAAVSALRLANVTVTALALGVLLFWLGRVCRDRRFAMVLGLWVALQPLFLLNVDRVANDALAVSLGTCAIVATMSLSGSLSSRRLWLQGLVIGLLLGLGIMAKATDLAIAPFVLFCLLLLVLRRQVKLADALLAAVLCFAVAGAITVKYFWFNYHHFHLLIPMQEAVTNRQNHVTLADALVWLQRDRWSYWWGSYCVWLVGAGLWFGGWSFIPPASIFVSLYGYALLASLQGWPLSWIFVHERWRPSSVFKAEWVVPRALVMGALVLAGMTVHSIESLLANGGKGSSTMAWYAEVGVPWLLIAVGTSALAWRHSRVGYVFAFFVPALFVFTEIYSVWGRMILTYARVRTGPLALHRLALLHPHFLGTPTLLLVTAAVLVMVAAAFAQTVQMLLLEADAPSSSDTFRWQKLQPDPIVVPGADYRLVSGDGAVVSSQVTPSLEPLSAGEILPAGEALPVAQG